MSTLIPPSQNDKTKTIRQICPPFMMLSFYMLSLYIVSSLHASFYMLVINMLSFTCLLLMLCSLLLGS
jgi:hypothetical protein